jgi:sn-glycerol 3-phosphate transport system ATP-binding protein
MAGIAIENVRKVYPGGVEAIHGLSVEIADGELCVLVGPSGCGKSTLLRMVAGLEEVTAGEIRIGDRRVNELEPAERDIAMVFQNYALYPHMSVYANMAYGLRNRGMKRDEIDRRIQEAATILHIEALLDRRPRQLSGGQRQRVAMGRAIVREPAAFLLDEPLSNLDTKLRAHMRGELKQLHARLGATFIYVTHDQVEAMSLADRIVVMNAGRIEQAGAPRAVYDHPASRFVAEFIGAPPMNFLSGAELGRAEPWVGVRPEALSLAPGEMRGETRGEPGGEARGDGIAVTGRVALVEDLGADSFIHIALADERTLVARLGAGATPAEGTMVTVRAPEPSLRFFDADGRGLAAPKEESGARRAAD